MTAPSRRLASAILGLAIMMLMGTWRLSAGESAPSWFYHFCFDLAALIRKQYPDVTFTLQGTKMFCAYNLKEYQVPLPSKKNGPWPLSSVMGPDKGGIQCKLEFRKGPYKGSCVVPQTYSNGQFYQDWLAPYSKRLNCHLSFELQYRDDTDKQFIKQVEQLVNHFERYAKTRT